MSAFLLLIVLLCQGSTSGDGTSTPEIIRRSSGDLVSLFSYLFEALAKRVDQQDEFIDKQEEINKELQRRVVSLSEQLELAKRPPVAGSGGGFSTYIRWGRNDCPTGNGTDLVYEGYTAGSHYEHGGGVNYLCLSRDPTWKEYVDGHQGGGYVYGSEYEFDDSRSSKFFQKHLLQQDVPCAVCMSQRPTIMMIPGRDKCLSGWTVEYSGYLVSQHQAHRSSEFVCLDSSPEGLDGGKHQNLNGRLIYFNEVQCGSLRCPPYMNGRELTCVVCTR